MTTALPPRPTDATLSVTKAARLLGVHPNTVRAWSDAGRLRYYRINPRGDRRYRLGDLQRFLAAAEIGTDGPASAHGSGHGPASTSDGHDRSTGRRRTASAPGQLLVLADPLENERHAQDLEVLDRLTRLAGRGSDLDDDLATATGIIRDGYDHALVAVWERRDGRLVPRVDANTPGGGPARLVDVPATYGVLGSAIAAADGLATTRGAHGPLDDAVDFCDVLERPLHQGNDKLGLLEPLTELLNHVLQNAGELFIVAPLEIPFVEGLHRDGACKVA